MNTTFLYGLIIAIAGTLLNYGLYFLGYHDSVEKMAIAQWVGGLGGMCLSIVILVMGVRARRAEIPATEPFGFGRAFLTSFLICFWSVVFGTISHVLYLSVVNPGFRDVMVQSEIAKMEAKGVPAAQIEQAEPFVRMISGPVAQGIFVFIGGLIMWTVVSLIVAAILKRPAAEPVPPAV